jgi:hypothetical protein
MERLNNCDKESRYDYVCINLKTKYLSKDCLRKLEDFGIECLIDAYERTAYGIVDHESLKYLKNIHLDEVVSISQSEPPNSK